MTNIDPLDLIRQSVTDSEARIATALAEAREEGREEGRREILRALPTHCASAFGVDCDEYECFYCEVSISVVINARGKTTFQCDHRPDCLWLRAQAVK